MLLSVSDGVEIWKNQRGIRGQSSEFHQIFWKWLCACCIDTQEIGPYPFGYMLILRHLVMNMSMKSFNNGMKRLKMRTMPYKFLCLEQWQCIISRNGGSTFVGSLPTATSQWIHGSLKKKQYKVVYIDGAWKAEDSSALDVTDNSEIRLGYANQTYFDGSLSQFYIWDEALSVDLIEVYNNFPLTMYTSSDATSY